MGGSSLQYIATPKIMVTTDMGDLIILICNVASFDYVFKSLLDDMGGSPSWLVTVESNLVVIGIVVV